MIRVGVLRGGQGMEYETSLKSGAEVLRALSSMPEKYIPVDIFIDRAGTWHVRGQPLSRDALLHQVDVFWNALHGIGEDGTLSRMLEDMGLPYVGTPALGSALAMNKLLSKEEFTKLGLKTPDMLVLPQTSFDTEEDFKDYLFQTAKKIFDAMPPPWVIKPKSGTGSRGVQYVQTFGELVGALAEASREGGDMIVEEYIPGREITIGMIEGFRGEQLYHLLPSEIKKPGKIWDSETRQKGEHSFIPVGTHISERELQEIGRTLFGHFGLRHYGLIELVESPKGRYILEVDTLPHLHEHGYFSHALARVGANINHLVDHLVGVAIGKK